MTLEKWAKQYNLDLEVAEDLQSAFIQYKSLGENAVSGRIYYDKLPRSNAEHSARWLEDRAEVREYIESAARAAGFDRVDFGVGLVPVLEKGNDTCIMIPLADNEDD